MSVPKEIGHIVLNVTDVERSTRFYRDVVGFQVSRYRPDGSGAFLTCGVVHHNLALFKAPAGARPTEKGAIGLNHFAFKVESYRALQAAHSRLVEARAAIDHIVDHGMTRSVYFLDPDGIMMELFSDSYATEEEGLAYMKSTRGGAAPMDITAAEPPRAPSQAPSPPGPNASALAWRWCSCPWRIRFTSPRTSPRWTTSVRAGSSSAWGVARSPIRTTASIRPSPRAESASTNTWRLSSRRGPRSASPSRANTIGATTCGCGPSRYSGLTRRSASGSPRKSPSPSSDAWDFPSSSTPPGCSPSPSWRRISSSTVRPGTRRATPGLLRWGFGCRSTWPRRPNAPTRSPGRAPWPPCKASAIASRTAPRVWGPPATGALRPNTCET